MKTALCVIDIQPGFVKGFEPRSLKNIYKKIDNAKKNRYPIIVIEMIGEGTTCKEIINRIGSYKFFIVKKSRGDGSTGIAKICKKLNIKKFILCGVYRTQCVLEAARGLAKKFPLFTVEVSWKATSEPYNTLFNYACERKWCRRIYKNIMREFKNIKIGD